MVPFHKLSQWLCYSLLEPMEAVGLKFRDMSVLTGLAEYRNGGLFVDMGVLALRDPDYVKDRSFSPGSELVVEWRALTLCLLDLLGQQARDKLGKSEEDFPLAKILQGGSWQAGRKIAQQKRPGSGAPPIEIRSTGAVF